MAKHHLRPAPSPSEVVDAFRAGRRRGPLHPREKLLIGWLGAVVVLVTWLSGVPLGASIVAFGGGLVALILALLPRPIIEGLDEVDWSNRWRFGRLIKFPVFWIGMVFCGLLFAQWTNPAFKAVWDPVEEVWNHVSIEHSSSLPSGVLAPPGEDSTGRALLRWTGIWLMGCAVWVGITRRRSLLAVLWIIGMNAIAAALVGVILFYQGAESVLGLFTAEEGRVASFFGRPAPAAAFFALCSGLCIGLSIYYFFESKRFLMKSDPSGVFFLGAIATAAMAALSGNAWALGVATIVPAAFAGYLGFLLIWKNVRGAGRVAGKVICALLAVGFVVMSFRLSGSGALSGLDLRDRTVVASSPEVRAELQRAVREASAERPWTGWGGGSVRYVVSGRERALPGFDEETIYHPNARNDLLEMLLETGRLGTLLALSCFGLLVWRLFTWRTLDNPLQGFLTLGLLAVPLVGWRESTLSAPAVGLVWVILLVCASLLAHMEQPARFRAPPNPAAPAPTPWEKRGLKRPEELDR